MAAVDWLAIKTEYVTGDTSYRKLCEKYGVPLSTLKRIAKSEEWIQQREQYKHSVATKTVNKIQKKTVDRAARVNDIADKLLDKLEAAVDELNMHLATTTVKIKEIEYKNKDRPDKPTKEVTREEEQIISYMNIIDRKGLKEIASALRDIKEVQMIRTKLDDEEQRAKIESLKKQVDGDANADKQIEVVLGDMEDYAT